MAGDAAIFRSFAPGTDLSIAHVRAGMEGRCTDTWDGLLDRADTLLDRSNVAVLTRLSASGLEEHVEMRITSRDYESLTAVVADEGRRGEIFQGTSGAMLRVNGQIVGMAIQSANASEATFLRIDEIKSRLARLLDARLVEQDYARLELSADVSSRGEDGICPLGAYEVAAVTCSHEPVSPEFACSNLTLGQPVRFAPGNDRVDIVLEIAGTRPVPLSAVHLGSGSGDDDVTPPQSIRIDIDSVSAATPRWRHFASTDMSPFGAFSVHNGAAPYAQRVKVSVQSVWDDSLPVQISCVRLE